MKMRKGFQGTNARKWRERWSAAREAHGSWIGPEVTIAKQGGVDAVLTAMRSHASVAAVQEYGCGALWNLAGNAENEVPAAEVEAEDSQGKILFLIDLV